MLNVVVEEHCFVDELDSLAKQYPRIEEIKDGVIWTLARNPYEGTPLPGEPGYSVYSTTQIVTPSSHFRVLYRFDAEEEKVYLWSIAPIEEGNNET